MGERSRIEDSGSSARTPGIGKDPRDGANRRRQLERRSSIAKLNVSGAFLIGIGTGSGPATRAVVSITTEDGEPVSLDPRESFRCFVALSATFGMYDMPLKIVDVETMSPGFYGLGLETEYDVGIPLGEMAPATIGVVVEDRSNRGQALACSCTAAREARWWAQAEMERPRSK